MDCFSPFVHDTATIPLANRQKERLLAAKEPSDENGMPLTHSSTPSHDASCRDGGFGRAPVFRSPGATDHARSLY